MLLLEGIYTLGPWIKKAVECSKYCLMGYTSRNLEDSGAKCYLYSRQELHQEVSEEMNFSVLPRDHSYTLVKNVADFCPCLKSLPEAKVKNFGLVLLAEDISKQPSIDSVRGYYGEL